MSRGACLPTEGFIGLCQLGSVMYACGVCKAPVADYSVQITPREGHNLELLLLLPSTSRCIWVHLKVLVSRRESNRNGTVNQHDAVVSNFF